MFQRNQGSRGRLHLQSLSPGAVVALLSAWPQVVVVRGHIKSISGNFWKQYIIKDTFRRTFSSCYFTQASFCHHSTSQSRANAIHRKRLRDKSPRQSSLTLGFTTTSRTLDTLLFHLVGCTAMNKLRHCPACSTLALEIPCMTQF